MIFQYFQKLCDRAKISVYRAGLLAGVRSRSRIAYAMRKTDGPHRSAALSTDVLLALAEQVGANADETTLFVLLGLKEHAPAELRDYITHLERENLSLRRKLDMPEGRFRIRSRT